MISQNLQCIFLDGLSTVVLVIHIVKRASCLNFCLVVLAQACECVAVITITCQNFCLVVLAQTCECGAVITITCHLVAFMLPVRETADQRYR